MRFLTLLICIATFASTADAGGVYRPYCGSCGTGYGHYTPNYYYYQPYVIEVQVYKDRYYSLSDLYRDRMLIEMFDMWKARISKDNDPNYLPPVDGPKATQPAPAPRSAAPSKKTTAAAVAVLTKNCLQCHDKGNKHLDLSDPDVVPMTKRWAAFGLVAAGDMPAPPKDVKNLVEWKQKNAVSEADMKAIYDGWVLTGQVAKKE